LCGVAVRFLPSVIIGGSASIKIKPLPLAMERIIWELDSGVRWNVLKTMLETYAVKEARNAFKQ
jgi:hypothetical protein